MSAPHDPNSSPANDSKYISLTEATALSGYTGDYIGKLCRGKWIDCQRSGRKWEVSRDSLTAYLTKAQNRKAKHYKTLSSKRRQEYESEAGESLARMSRRAGRVVSQPAATAYAPYVNGQFSALSIALVLVVVSTFLGLMGVVPGAMTAQVGDLSVRLPTLTDAENVAHRWYRFVRTLGSSEEIPATMPIVEGAVPPASPTSGMVVLPAANAASSSIEEIRNSFSDDVTVHPTGDGSGYVTPTFGDDAGDAYWYVMVPVYQQGAAQEE